MVTSQTFDPFEGDKRLLLIFSPSEEDDRFDGQLLCINDYKEGLVERDVVVYEVFESGESRVSGEPLAEVDAESLRMRFGVGKGDFFAVLVGKDGGEKERWTEPVPPGELFRLIDAMPMRQREVVEGPSVERPSGD